MVLHLLYIVFISASNSWAALCCLFVLISQTYMFLIHIYNIEIEIDIRGKLAIVHSVECRTR